MKRILCSLLLLVLLSGCTAISSPSTTATPDTAEKEPISSVKSTSAATEKPTEPAPTITELAERRISDILKADLHSGSASIDVDPIEQYPELPTGCESVALTMAMNALGCKLSKTDIAENYLQYDDNFAIGFCGDPFSDGGAGVMPIGIIRTVENYTAATGAPIYAYNTSHHPLSDLYKFIEAGCPVVIWTTYYMDEPMYTDDGMYYDDEYYMWYYNEHCVTLCGYDRSAGTVKIADPLQGMVTYDADAFERINQDIGGWSVILLDTSHLDQPFTEAPTEKPTEKPTAKPTEKPSETQPSTKQPTEKHPASEKPTATLKNPIFEKPTAAPRTEIATEKPTTKPTEKPTEKPTVKPKP